MGHGGFPPCAVNFLCAGIVGAHVGGRKERIELYSPQSPARAAAPANLG
jgi:hypothetical protein